MFESLGAQLDDWLHVWNLRRLRLARRLGLLPKPTAAQLEAAEGWANATELLHRMAPSIKALNEDLTTMVNGGMTINLHKYGNLRTVAPPATPSPPHVSEGTET